MLFINCVTIEKQNFDLKLNSFVERMVKWHKLLKFTWSPISTKFRLNYRHLIFLERVLTRADESSSL